MLNSRTAPRPWLWLLVPGTLLASSALVHQASNAAFSATTSNPSNSWATGSVQLTDDDGGTSPSTGTAMFSLSGLKPGDSGERCILVTSQSSLPATVKLRTSSVSSTNSLSTYLDLVVQSGSGGTFGGGCGGFTSTSTDFTGTLSVFGTKTSYSSAVGSWSTTAPNQTRTYRVAYTLNTATPDSAQSSTASATVVWEAQTA